MITFLLITLAIIIGNASVAFILYICIQKEQILDVLFNWQNRLRNLDLSGTTSGLIFYKIGGGCLLCFSHFLSFIGFWIYLLFVIHLGADFIYNWMWIIIYFIYVPTSTTLTLYIHKILK